MTQQDAPPPPDLRRIAQVGLFARDLDRAIAFYGGTLGFKVLLRTPRMAFFDVGGTWLLVGLPEGPGQAPGGSILYLETPDIDASHRALAARGVAFRGAPALVYRAPDHDLWLAEFADPDGNHLALHCRRPR